MSVTYGKETEKDIRMAEWVWDMYMTESAAAAKWRCPLLQTVGGYVRTAPGPLTKNDDDELACRCR